MIANLGILRDSERSKEVRFEECESWKHRLAKELLAGWMMQDAIRFETQTDEWHIPARRDTGWVCLREYPVYEHGDPLAFRDEVCPKGDDEQSGCREGLCRCGSCRHADGFGRFVAVLDIAWGWKGQMEAAVEIRHTHPVPDDKAALIQRVGLVLVEIDAEAIMRQVGRPSRLRAERIVWPARAERSEG
jgi:hypothetical protein